VPSLARGFSAPIIVDYPYSESDLAFLARSDSDPFNRWEAAQRLICTHVLRLIDAAESGQSLALAAGLRDIFAQPLAADPGFQARILQLPSEMHLAGLRKVVEPDAIGTARQFVRSQLGRELREHWSDIYAHLADSRPYRPAPADAGRRALRNLALGFLVDGGDADALRLARLQLELADNLTDRLAALIAIVGSTAAFKEDVLEQCARSWRAEPLLMNKWFNVQATTTGCFGGRPLLARVRSLLDHRSFSMRNPNNVYALVLGFCAHNPREFHRADGSGYDFWAEQVIRLDRINPTVAARIARALERWRRYTPDRASRMRTALLDVAATKALSRDVREIVARLLSA
jgi:aminopeptidase N